MAIPSEMCIIAREAHSKPISTKTKTSNH